MLSFIVLKSASIRLIEPLTFCGRKALFKCHSKDKPECVSNDGDVTSARNAHWPLPLVALAPPEITPLC